jgi:hypothetical protein
MKKQHLKQAEQAVLMWPMLVLSANTQQILSYDAVGGFTGIARQGLHEALGMIHGYCKKRRWPFLNVLVVNRNTGLPGKGFPEKMTSVQILTEQNKVFVFDWYGHDKPRPQDLKKYRLGQ